MALQRVRSNMLANNFTLDDDQGLIVGSGNNIYIDTVNNRVGINTNSPTHDFTVSGNIHATGNITASGDIQLGDSDTDTITISAEIGSDILPDITNTYDLGSASKVWAEVHATTLYGDGSQLTGIAATLDDILTNGNTSALNIDLTGGTVTATSFIGDGSQLTGLASTLNDILGNGNTTALNIVSTGDITATNFIGNGSQLTGLASTLDEVTTNGATTTNSITVGDLTVNSTNAIGLPVGTTAQRPTAANGLMRFNSTLLEFEGYNGTEWGALGGGGATYSTSAPTVNLSEGDLWFDTGTTGELYVYSGTEWLSVTGAGGTAFYQRSFTGDNTTTVFNVYGTGSATVLVYINGIFVTSPDDYSYSAGSVTFVTAPALNDEINVLVYGSTTGISLDINSLTDVSAASPSTGQVLKWTGTNWTPQADNSPTGDANRIVYDLSDPTNSVVLTSGDANTPATYRGDVVDNSGNVIVDVSSTSTTFTGGLACNVYGDVYNTTGANKILESGTGNLDAVLTVDTANATTLNATTTNISGIATFTGGSADFTGTTTMGSWNGPVYDRTGSTLIIEDDATPNPIVHADLDGDVTGTVSSIANHDTDALSEGSTNLYYTDARVGTYISGDRTYGNITTTGYVAGPAVFTIDPAGVGDNTGKVVIAGDLQVDGITTTINSTTLTVDDKNIVLASGSADAATANGAGITVDGANATLLYQSTGDKFAFNKSIDISGSITSTSTIKSDSAFGGFITLKRSDTTTTNNSDIGAINFEHTDSDDAGIAATILASGDGSAGGGKLSFLTGVPSSRTTRLTILSNGNVGIGTSSPSYPLHVKSSATTTAVFDAGSDGYDVQLRMEQNGAFVGAVGYDDDLNAVYLNRYGNATQGLTVISGGNVGIGTSSPEALLHLKSTAAGSTPSIIFENTVNAQNMNIDYYNNAGAVQSRIQYSEGPASFNFIPNVSTSASALYIAYDGKVGIGTTSSAHKLEVAGTTKAEQYLLDAIAKDISDSANDIFIYDTRKDSDGGAWRKRTQNTSWYNETLNTATRGARREFPSVAVIVAEAQTVTIYDGDDPDMPMWMEFNVSGGTEWQLPSLLCANTVSVTGITALNGIITSSSNPYGYRYLNFISERSEFRELGYYRLIKRPIIDRNATNNIDPVELGSDGHLVADGCHDVAMTVLPNAPIDSATGLPAPTIAVATDSGVNVIKDNGTVVDSGDTNNFSVIKFSPNGTLIGMHSAGHRLRLFNDYNADGFTYTSYATNDISGPQNALSPNGNADGVDGVLYNNGFDWGFTSGLTKMILDDAAPTTQSMLSQITSDYNTGYQVGDIKLATLSDTDDTNLGTELVTNGTFTSNVDGWSTNPTVASWSSVNSQAVLVQDSNSTSYWAWQQVTVVAGKTYRVSIDVISTTNTSYFRVGSGGEGSSTYLSVNSIGTGTTTRTFTVPAGVTSVFINVGVTISGTIVFDNVSLKQDVEDRSSPSTNGDSLKVFGTITKSAVATGADLMAYSGFGNGNYLHQPYNSDLDFGTGTFSITTWAKIPTVNSYSPTLVDRHVLNQARILLYAEYGNQQPRIYIAHTNGSTSTYVTGPTAIDDGQWHCWHANRRGNGQLELWIDGVKVAYGGIGVDSISVSTNGPTIIGNDYTGGGTGYMNGDMALTRISATAPSPEQIAKIYEDEKVLFQENAKATLYGSSDAVTALAYDDDTELLHVGTSAGRSVFQGLRRIDNTTDAVGAAISASNGMVAED